VHACRARLVLIEQKTLCCKHYAAHCLTGLSRSSSVVDAAHVQLLLVEVNNMPALQW